MNKQYSLLDYGIDIPENDYYMLNDINDLLINCLLNYKDCDSLDDYYRNNQNTIPNEIAIFQCFIPYVGNSFKIDHNENTYDIDVELDGISIYQNYRSLYNKYNWRDLSVFFKRYFNIYESDYKNIYAKKMIDNKNIQIYKVNELLGDVFKDTEYFYLYDKNCTLVLLKPIELTEYENISDNGIYVINNRTYTSFFSNKYYDLYNLHYKIVSNVSDELIDKKTTDDDSEEYEYDL